MTKINRRTYQRSDLQVIVNVNFHGHEKVFDAKSRNVSFAGIYLETDPEMLELFDIGASIGIMIEYAKNLFVRLHGYTVRVDPETPGFAVKFLDLDENQKEVLQDLMASGQL